MTHDAGIEVACNVLDEATTSTAAVLQRCKQLAQHHGGAVVSSYRIGRSKDDLLGTFEKLQVPE